MRNPGLRLLPAMLIGVGIAAAITWFALGLRTRTTAATPELELRLERDGIRLPDGTLCPVAQRGCDAALARLPAARLRIHGPPDAMFALAVPALQVAARAHREVLLDDGSSPVSVEPRQTPELQAWSNLDIDAPGLRLRVIMREDGFWLGSAVGKVLGGDPRGPTILPRASGQDFQGLSRKVKAVKANLPHVEDTVALLPALDLPLSDVVRAAVALHGTFDHVLVAVP